MYINYGDEKESQTIADQFFKLLKELNYDKKEIEDYEKSFEEDTTLTKVNFYWEVYSCLEMEIVMLMDEVDELALEAEEM